MPKTPPLILPNSFPNWFNTPADEHGDKPTTATIEKRSEEIQHILEADISSFTYTPSDEDDDDDDEDDTISDLGRSKFSQGSNRSHKSNHSNTVVRDVNNLYHKPSSSNKSSQQRHRSVTPVVVNENSSEQYQLEDDDMDDILESQQHHPSTDQQQNVHNERECPATDTQNAMEDDTFYVAIDQLTQEYQAYAEEYREFKRYVDSAKRELLDYINGKTPYFEERGAQLSQKWESLKEYI